MDDVPIRCEEIQKVFDKRRALESVTFEVTQPSVVALVGPNGSGKTTLLRILVGQQTPSAGSVRVLGRLPRDARLRGSDVAYVSSAERLMPELTILENMVYRGCFHGIPPKAGAATAELLLEERRLTALRDRRPDTLSTGQQRQVALLAALISDPRVLLLDEPTTGVDILASSEIYELMRRVCAADCTIVLATHQLEELLTLSSRTIALCDGRVVYDGPTVDLGVDQSAVRRSLHKLFRPRTEQSNGGSLPSAGDPTVSAATYPAAVTTG